MFKVLLIALVLFIASASTVQTNQGSKHVLKPLNVLKEIHKEPPKYKGKIHCVEKCMEKVKDERVRICKKAYVLGGLVRKCSTKRIKGLCSLKCKPGRKFCFTKCQTKFCEGSRIRTCKTHCSYGKECRKACCWKYQKRCIFSRLPGHFVDKCRFITKQLPFKDCLKSCTRRIKIKTCAQKCKNVRVPEEYKKCLTFLVRKERHIRKCSVVGHHKICKKQCFKGKKRCKKSCHKTLCKGRKVEICGWKCTRPTFCHVRCSLKKQIKCLMERIPPKYRTECRDLFKFKNVHRCFTKCHIKHIVVPVNE